MPSACAYFSNIPIHIYIYIYTFTWGFCICHMYYKTYVEGELIGLAIALVKMFLQGHQFNGAHYMYS